MIIAKAQTKLERSDAIVVSFGAKWYQKIQSSSFSVIIRKRVPTGDHPRWLYFHVNTPVSRICARATIRSIQHLSLEEALALANEIDLPDRDIKTYVAYDGSIGAYMIKNIEMAQRAISSSELQGFVIYFPPQSFLFLSHDGKRILDLKCGFSEISRQGKKAAK